MPAGVVANQGPNGGARTGASKSGGAGKKKGGSGASGRASTRPSSPGAQARDGDMEVEPMSLSAADANDDDPAPRAKGKGSKGGGKSKKPASKKRAGPEGEDDAASGDEGSTALRESAGAAPASKKRAKKATAAAGGRVAPVDAQEEQPAGGAAPTDDQLRDMRVRARTGGLRRVSRKVGYASKYALDEQKVEGVRGYDAVANCLSREDAARLMRSTPVDLNAACYGEEEALMRIEAWGSKLPPTAAREAQAQLESVFRSVVGQAVTNTIYKGTSSVSPMAMFQVLRPYVEATELSHSTLPAGLIRELRTAKVIVAPEGEKPEEVENRKTWQQENNKQKKLEKAISEKLVARKEQILEEFRTHQR
jgi:hypothetical protein